MNKEVKNIFTPPALRQCLVAHVAAWEQLAATQPFMLAGPGMLERFILRNATVSGRGEREMPYGMPRGQAKSCFRNAYREADEGGIFTYCEGFAMHTARSPFPFLHAWLVNLSGAIYDPTLRDAHHFEYLGIKVPYPQLRAETERTGVYGLLDPGSGINKEFLDRYEKELTLLKN